MLIVCVGSFNRETDINDLTPNLSLFATYRICIVMLFYQRVSSSILKFNEILLTLYIKNNHLSTYKKLCPRLY